MRIREATVADVDVIVSHRSCMFAEMGHGYETSRAAMAAGARPFIKAALQDGSYRGWLVEDERRIVAGGGLLIVGFPPTPRDPSPRRVWILNMYTDPPHRRRGLAKELLLAMIAWCRQEGFRSVHLHASEAGRPLYARLGFRPTSEMLLVLE